MGLIIPAPLSGDRDMDSAPTARPQSMDPALMLSAIALTAINPELQNLLRHIVEVVTGNPAAKAAVQTLYPASGSRAFPRTMSCIASGLIFDSPRTPWNQPQIRLTYLI